VCSHTTNVIIGQEKGIPFQFILTHGMFTANDFRSDAKNYKVRLLVGEATRFY